MDDGKYFVRAPPKHQYPRELSRYHDHDYTRFDGKTIAWERGMKEFPDSLPRHGRPPRYPFERVRGSFVITDNISDLRSSSFVTSKSRSLTFGLQSRHF